MTPRFMVPFLSASLLMLTVPSEANAGGPGCSGDFVLDAVPLPRGPDAASLDDVVAVGPNDAWAVGHWEIRISLTEVHLFTYVLRFDGTGWSIVPSPTPGSQANPVSRLHAVDAVSPDEIYAVGNFNAPGPGTTETIVTRWDGSSWDLLPETPIVTPLASGYQLHDIRAIDSDDIWIVGGQPSSSHGGYAVHFDGSSYTVFETPNVLTDEPTLLAVDATGPDDVWAVGRSGDFSGTGAYVTRYDGRSWSVVDNPYQTEFQTDLRAVVTPAPDDVWVAGFHQSNPLLMHWDGSSWTEFVAPAVMSDFVALAPDDIYAIGGETLSHWDGQSWSIVDEAGVPGSAALFGISALDDCSLVTVGRIGGGFDPDPVVARYDAATCSADLDQSGAVDVDDLIVVLMGWNALDAGADVNGDHVVDIDDLTAVLLAWGAC